jgi:hypothetical protein
MFNLDKSFIHSKSRGHHVLAPTTADLILPNELLTSFTFNPKYMIILFMCLMFEHDQRHSNKDVQSIQKSLLIHGNTEAANKH